MPTIDHDSTRLNTEVVLFKGCTVDEIVKIFLISLSVSCIVFSVLSSIIFGNLMLGVALSLPLSLFPAFMTMRRLQSLKRGKPDGYYQQYLTKLFSELGIIKSPYVFRSGRWITQRQYHV